MTQPTLPRPAAEHRPVVVAADPPDGGGPSSSGTAARNALRPVVGFLANVTVLTALLVYFGWRRSATQADRLGIAESVLGMSTRDYLLRSVRPVLVLLVGVGVAGLLWVLLDRWLQPRISAARTAAARTGAPPAAWVRVTLLGLATAWLVLPALAWLLGFVAPALAFVLFPVGLGLGVLLLLYAAHLRQLGVAGDEATRRRDAARLLCGALLAGVCLFWTAANYAQVEGVQLARDISRNITGLPGVVVYSEHPLHLDGPGVDERTLPAAKGELRFRYTGLRLLEHTGGKYFLVSDGWSTTYGVMFVLPDDDRTVRADFLRDRR